jgi:glutaconyl-CoA/methylmalonyl-CoA decarboxylase subunit gamma
MKQYNITVNGTAYAVEVEELGGTSAPKVAHAAPAPVAAPAPAAAPAAAAPAPATKPAAPAAAPSAGATTINAPIPGTVLDIRVTPGQAVKSGDILLILEAMKMENEIMSPVDGTIDVVTTTKGSAVNAGDLMLTIK